MAARSSAEVDFPDGTTVTASPLSVQKARRARFDYGLYMHEGWDPPWDHEWIDWPDFGLPRDGKQASGQILRAFDRARSGERVEIGCEGGLGRTGTVLACMAILAGVAADEAVDWVHAHYDARAVETDDQAAWVNWFGRRVRSADA